MIRFLLTWVAVNINSISRFEAEAIDGTMSSVVLRAFCLINVMSAKPGKGRFSLNYGKIISEASLKQTRKINLSQFQEVGDD